MKSFFSSLCFVVVLTSAMASRAADPIEEINASQSKTGDERTVAVYIAEKEIAKKALPGIYINGEINQERLKTKDIGSYEKYVATHPTHFNPPTEGFFMITVSDYWLKKMKNK
ncbi:MAG: hypothetical protein R3A45_05305, partial [Bdellovibrionota bacterium]